MKTEDCFFVSGGTSWFTPRTTEQTNAAYAAMKAPSYVAGNWITEVLKWGGGSYAWDRAKDYASSKVGVAGSNPPANENDNGGTSFGTSTYNTFGGSDNGNSGGNN